MHRAVPIPRTRRRTTAFATALAVVAGLALPALWSPPPAAQAADLEATADFRVLVFSETAGFRHGSITPANTLIEDLAEENGFEAVFTEDSSVFAPANAAELALFDAVVFNSTTGDVLTADEQTTFEEYIRGGGGYAGIHSASDTEYDWPFYGGLVGGYFNGHPAPQQATVKIEDKVNPSTMHLEGDTWVLSDEWYNYRNFTRDNVHVLLSLDETSYTGGTQGADHPIAWCQADYEGGRSWYTGLGHIESNYEIPAFRQHILGGLEIAAGVVPSGCSATQSANYEKITLDDNTQNPMAMDIAPDGKVFYAERNGRLQQIDPDTNATTTALTLAVTQANEDGLLGVVLDPDFAENGWVYLYYAPNNVGGDGPHNRLSRFTYDFGTKTASLASEKVLMKVTTQRNTCCHAGGDMLFDNDGNLVLATGDNTNPFESDGYAPIDERTGRSDFDAQKSSANTNDLRGKVLRITPQADGTYTIPEGNLFDEAEDTANKTRPEVYAMGFRNPFRIGLDPQTNKLFVADYGPDAGAANANRGPGGTVEWNIVDEPGNYGWPLCVGIKCYRDWNFATSTAGAAFDPAAPINNSPNNTGLTTLPPVIQPEWWTENGTAALYPEIGNSGAPMGGPVYRFDPDLESETKWPAYWDGKAIFGEWNQGKQYSIQLDEETGSEIVDINRILPAIFDGGGDWHRSMDFEFGPDGALYVIDWGSDFGGSTADSGVYRIDYVQGSPSPIARASADVTNGPDETLTVNFSSEGTRHPLALDYTLEWNFGDGTATSSAANPTHTYEGAGRYTAQLTVTDELGHSAVANVQIVVGNAVPTVEITFPEQGGFFEWGDQVRYEVTVNDPDASGPIDCSNVTVVAALGHDSHNHDFGEQHGCEGSIQTIRDAGHGLEANLFWVINVNYADDGGAAGVPLTGFGTNILNPKYFQAEYFDETGRIGGTGGADDGVRTETTGDSAGGGRNVSHIETNDWWAYEPINLKGIDSVSLRIAKGFAGDGTIAARWNSPTGPTLGTVTFQPTNGSNGQPAWQTYRDFPMALDTSATNGETGKLYFVLTSGGANVNNLVFEGDGVDTNASPTGELTVDVTSGEPPLAVNASIDATDPDGDSSLLTYKWDAGTGGGFVSGTSEFATTYTTPGAYTLTVRVTDGGGAYRDFKQTITVDSAPIGICYSGRSDGFDGTALDTTNRWNRSVRTDQFAQVANGALTIPASLTDIHAAGTGTSNIVLQDIPEGAFSMTAKVNFPARVQYQQAGLTIYGDDDNYLKLVQMARGQASDPANRVFQFLKEDDATPVERNSAALGADFPDTYYVRLASDGTTVTASYSANGTDFTTMSDTFTLAGISNPKIGLLALGSNSAPSQAYGVVNAKYDWFQVTPDDTATADTPNDEFDGAALDACRWEVVNEDASGYRVADGRLQIDTSPFDIYNTDTGVTNFVLQPQPATDWVVETKVDASEFDRRYQQGGLILYKDSANYVKLDILATNEAGQAIARNLEMRSEIGNAVQNPQPNAPAPANGLVWLRLEKVGTTFTGYSSTDGVNWTAIAQTVSNTALADAKVGLYALGNSAQGQVSNTAYFDYFKVVEDPLEVTASVTPESPTGENGWYTGDVTVAVDAQGSSGTVYREVNLDGAGWVEYTAPVVVTEEGEHELQYRASTSSAGSTEAQSVSFKIDRTAPVPTASVATDEADPTLRTLELAAEDATSGVDSIEYRIGDAEWAAYGDPVELPTGASTVEYRATDVAGNTSEVASLEVPALESPLDVTVVAGARCVAGKAVLTLQTTNNEEVPLTVAYTTAYGTKSFAAVAPGKNAFHAFTTRLVELPAGTATVTVTGVVAGESITTTTEVEYPAYRCG
ncbi:ThuA domain-containing protein [Agromyces allii]|uniref:DUF1349 domain-containing protein n=1 Tax=Agromyces allii TaxID=393607 RepID=A0ABN2QYH2_9MICO|nr:ThuA domain-containing protein [Agromyces allii]